MAEIKLRKGYEIPIAGASEKTIADAPKRTTFAIKPTDWRGLKPKLEIEVGNVVKAGTPLFHEKAHPDVKFTAPVSGTVTAINRGDRRYIQEIVIESDGQFTSETFDVGVIDTVDAEQIRNVLLSSGLWPAFNQRPFGMIANPNVIPRDIFISGFDSAPLAADLYLVIADRADDFKTGIKILQKLTEGDVWLSLDGSRSDAPDAYKNLDGVKINTFSGKHPVGTVGVQIHNLKPINRGEVVWTIMPNDVAEIGHLFSTGSVANDTIVAVAGGNAKTRQYYKTKRGAAIADFMGEIEANSRIISGDVLTGTKVREDGYVGFHHHTVTVIPEGDEFEFLGWVLPGLDKPSFSGTYLSKFFGAKQKNLNTNLHGGHRNFVATGVYEQVLPMDVLPVHLLKACLSEEIEEMEGLGIYEVIEEDLALCEYVCSSKVQVHDILSDGINLMIRETT